MLHETPPAAPDGIADFARDAWDSFWRSDVAQLVRESDMPRLVRWIEAVDELARVRVVLTQSRLVRGSTGQPVLNPLAGYAQQLAQEVERAEEAFGMTPAARVRLFAGAGHAEATLDLEFARLVDTLSSPMDDTEN